MFGDFILWFKYAWKEFLCIHNYEWFGSIGHKYLYYTKCGKMTKNPKLGKETYFKPWQIKSE